MRATTSLLFVVVLLMAGARPAAAQGLVYGVAGPAGVSGFFRSSAASVHAAGGGEVLAGGRAGVGGELGVLANTSSALLVFSANGVFHFQPITATRRFSPFVTGGYTHIGSGEGAFHAWNIGAGGDFMMKDHVGLRVDVRDHVRPDARGTVQYWTVRVGVVFRTSS